METLSVHDMLSDDDGGVIGPPPQAHQIKLHRSSGGNATKTAPKKSSSTINDANTNGILLSIKADTTATRTDLQSTRHELAKLSQRTELKLKSFDDRLTKASTDMKTLFSKVKAIETKMANGPLTSNVELDKQNKLRNNISIANFPPEQGEDLSELIVELLAFIGCENFSVRDELIEVRRVQRSRSNLIIAKFRDESRKMEIMKKKAGRAITLNDLYNLREGEPNPRIYVNTQLTPFFSNLSYHGRMAISRGCIHSCWVTSRGFMVRATAEAEPTIIENHSQLEQLVPTHDTANGKRRFRSLDAGNNTSPTASNPSKSARIQPIASESIEQLNAATEALNVSAVAQCSGDMVAT